MGSYVKLIWLFTISILLLGVSVVWFYKEINPEWKQCQRAEIQERIEKVRESYEFYTDPEMAPSSPEDKKEFLERYTCAREAQADLLADQIINIADDHKDDTIINPSTGAPQMNAEWVARCKLQIDARKWKASKLAPKKYGDKVDVTTGGEKINSITGIDITRPNETSSS